jgi:group I intron endonuclease
MDTYRATNTLNGNFYIGSTSDFNRRKKEHLCSQKNLPFANALRKNPEAFIWEVWSDDCDEPVLEQALLDMWVGKEQCYNICPVANRVMAGRHHTEETKQKIREKKLGFRHSEEAKKKIGEAARINRTGVSVSEITKQKLREINTGEKHPKYGIPVSQEVKEKIRKSNIGKNAGKKWWVNEGGDNKFQIECPGEGWRKGRK